MLYHLAGAYINSSKMCLHRFVVVVSYRDHNAKNLRGNKSVVIEATTCVPERYNNRPNGSKKYLTIRLLHQLRSQILFIYVCLRKSLSYLTSV